MPAPAAELRWGQRHEQRRSPATEAFRRTTGTDLSTAPDVLAGWPERRAAPAARPGRSSSVPPLLVLALVGGVTYAIGSLSGGGDQPAEALPTGALALLSASTSTRRRARRSTASGSCGSSRPCGTRCRWTATPARSSSTPCAASSAGPTSTSTTDVSPWLGKRLAVAVYPPVDAPTPPEPVVVVALQVTDEDKAEAGLSGWGRRARDRRRRADGRLGVLRRLRAGGRDANAKDLATGARPSRSPSTSTGPTPTCRRR